MTFSHFTRRFTSLPDVFLQGENIAELNDNEPQEITIARAEARARDRQRRNGSRQLRGTDRQFAEALHREADSLHYKGDFETALVLYHRAASVCPRDSSHGVAARRTAAAINALSYPSKALNGLLPKVRNGAQQSAVVCPESAGLRASRILTESPDPVSVVPEILNFFDGRTDFWRIPKIQATPSRRNLATGEKSSAMMTMRLTKMESILNAGDPAAALWIGSDILKNLSNGSTTEFKMLIRYEAKTHRLLALAHVALERHDRAVASASRMIRAALTADVALLITEALVTLGKVHLTFGHLNAAAQAWERLIPFVSELVPKAWLFHEIGRCHLESGHPEKALEMAVRCLDTAEAADSEKWTFHGRLLLGQILAQMGRFTEAASALESLIIAEKEVGDACTLAYVRDLTERLIKASNSEKLTSSCFKAQSHREKFADQYFQDSSTRSELFSSSFSSHSDEDHTDETLLKGAFRNVSTTESLCSEGSSLSQETTSTRTIMRNNEPSMLATVVAAGGSDDSDEHESSVMVNSLEGTIHGSQESIPTGRTYGVSSPLFQCSVKRTNRDVIDSETLHTIFGP